MGLMKRASLSVLAGAVVGLTTACGRHAPSARAEDVVLHDGGAGLAADAHHEGSVDKQYKAPSRQHREARARLHPVAGLLHAPHCLAHLGREEVQHGGVRHPVARRLRRGRLLPEDQRLHRRRSGAAGDLQGPASEPGHRLLDLSVQVGELLRLPAVAGRAGQLLPQGHLLQRGRADELPGEVRQEAALHAGGDGQRRLGHGSRLRRVLPAQEGRHAGRQAADGRLLRHRLSRPARATTSRRCRSTASSGSMAPTSGTRPRRPRARPKAW